MSCPKCGSKEVSSATGYGFICSNCTHSWGGPTVESVEIKGNEIFVRMLWPLNYIMITINIPAI